MNEKELAERTIRELNEQLYAAYRRIVELQTENEKLRQQYGDTAGENR